VALASGKSPFTVAGQRRLFTALPEHSTSVFSSDSETKDLHCPPRVRAEKLHKPQQENLIEGDNYIKDAEYRTPQYRPSLDYLFRESALTFLRGQFESR
jgi:hypothetical protein